MTKYTNDEEIRQLIDKLERQTQRSLRTRYAVFLSVLIVWTLSIFYIADLIEARVVAELLQLGSEQQVSFAALSIKKEGAVANTDIVQTEADDAAAVAIRSELHNVVRRFGATEQFRQLSASEDDWNAYVDSQNDRGEFVLAMAALRALGIAEFTDEDFSGARLTERGRELDSGGAIPDRGHLTAPNSEREELVVGTEGVKEDVVDEDTENWYEFTIGDSETYVIRTTRVEEMQPVDTVLRLFDAGTQVEIGYDDDSGESTYSMLREYLEQGDYLLGVASYDGRPGYYQVAVASEAADMERQRRDRKRLLDGALELLPNGMAETGNVEEQQDVWYKLDITDRGTHRIATSAPETGAGVDTIVRLYQGDGQTLVGEDDDSGDGYYSLLHEDLVEGVYYVRVSSFWRVSGSFRITAALLE